MGGLTVIQKAIFNHLLHALIEARESLVLMPAEEALRFAVAYGKSDTLMLDAIPEVTIRRHVEELDSAVLLITEESASSSCWPTNPMSVIISDPTDRSSQFAKYIERWAKESGVVGVTLGDLFHHPEAIARWEADFSAPVSITGPTTSVTCLWSDGSIVFSILLNYLTNGLVVVANSRVIALDAVPEHGLDFDGVMSGGRPVIFPSRKVDATLAHRKYVTFLKKSAQYLENLKDSMVVFDDPMQSVHYDAPGGPSRPLYLSDFQLPSAPIGFILANGEKLPEWIGWLAYVKVALTQHHEKGLRLFEVFTSRPHMRDGVLMSTSPHYSFFHQLPSGEYRIDISRLRHFAQPSQFRSMLVVVPNWNFPIVNALCGHNYREIIF